jgi:hypothetical protein
LEKVVLVSVKEEEANWSAAVTSTNAGMRMQYDMVEEKFNVTIEAEYTVGEYDIALLSAKERTSNDIIPISNQNKVDFGLNLGLAFDLKNGVFFQTRYNLGLSNINEGLDKNEKGIANSVIHSSIGIKF